MFKGMTMIFFLISKRLSFQLGCPFQKWRSFYCTRKCRMCISIWNVTDIAHTCVYMYVERNEESILNLLNGCHWNTTDILLKITSIYWDGY